MTNSPTVDIKQFLGLRNTARQRKQPVGALSLAQNIDIDDEGAIVTRNGYVKSVNGTSITAAYAPRHGDYGYVVDSGRLLKVTTELSTIDLGAVSSERTVWTEAGDYVFLSTGKVINDDTLLDWRVDPPDALQCRTTTGSLAAGQYQLVATLTTADGRESASSGLTILDVSEGGAIQIDNAAGKNIYVTEANGEVFYYAGTGLNYITSTLLLSIPLDPALLLNNPLPDGIEQIAYYSGSVYYSLLDQVNNTSIVGWSKPFRWHVFDVSDDYILVPGQVRCMVATGQEQDKNLIIATERQVFAFNGDSLVELAAYGVPSGVTASRSLSGLTLLWTERGVCSLDPFQNLTWEKASLTTGSVDNTYHIAHDGIEQFVVLTDSQGAAEYAVT